MAEKGSRDGVRRNPREARRQQAVRVMQTKLEAVRAAAAHRFPTADIEQMLADIESGYAASKLR